VIELTEQMYQRLIRKHTPSAARLHQIITVRRVAGGGYTTEQAGKAGEIFATLPEAQEARRAIIMLELLSLEQKGNLS
jgi:hypothetical protein